jgi:IS30 family transposase
VVPEEGEVMMPKGRRSQLTVTLTLPERHQLEHYLRQTTLPRGIARRVQLVLLRADGVTIVEIAKRVDMARKNIYKWLKRFQERRIAGLEANDV